MKTSALLLITGVYLCLLTLAAAVGNLPTLLIGLLCVSGVGLIISAVHEMINHN